MIEYKPDEVAWCFNRDQVIARAIRMAAAAQQPVALTIADATVTVQPCHSEQIRDQLNAMLPQVLRQ